MRITFGGFLVGEAGLPGLVMSWCDMINDSTEIEAEWRDAAGEFISPDVMSRNWAGHEGAFARELSTIIGVLSALPVAVLILVPLLGGSIPGAMLCALGTASLVVLLYPILTARPLDVWHPFTLLAISIFFGTAGKAFYIVFSRSSDWAQITDGKPPEEFFPVRFSFFVVVFASRSVTSRLEPFVCHLPSVAAS